MRIFTFRERNSRKSDVDLLTFNNRAKKNEEKERRKEVSEIVLGLLIS